VGAQEVRLGEVRWEEYIIEKKKTDALVVASNESGLEVNPDKTKYLVMSRDLELGQSHNTTFDNSSFEREKQLK
jgi:hypothetical protein